MKFFVPGIPVAQGSKRVVPTAAGHRSIEANRATLLPWRESVIHHARAQAELTSTPRLDDGVAAYLYFTFPRPKSHYGTGRNAGRLKDTAPKYKVSAPDLDKLVRAVLDALTQASVLRDDALVFALEARKSYGEIAGVHVEIRPI